MQSYSRSVRLNRFRWLGLALAILPLTGCIHHQIAFIEDENSDWHYEVVGARIGAPLVVEVSEATQAADYMFTAVTAGAANRWHARYGEMFMQVLAVELPQLAPNHTITSDSDQTSGDTSGNTAGTEKPHRLELDVPSYLFENFAANTTVTAVLTDPQGQELLDERYSVIGESKGGRVMGAGAFGMKSAVRQSTLNAYKRVFEELREDLRAAMSHTAR